MNVSFPSSLFSFEADNENGCLFFFGDDGVVDDDKSTDYG